MIIHSVNIKLKPNQALLLIPLGDIQSESEHDRLVKLVKWCLDREKEGYIVRIWGQGDYFETFSPSERAALASANGGYGLHETTTKRIDKWVQDQADEFYSIIKPLKGRVMGLLKGHHKHDFFVPQGATRGLSTDEYLCHKLDCVYFGSVVVIKLLINGLLFKVFATHGYGSARTKGAKLNKRLRMRDAYLDANWYVMGHDNEKMVDVDEPLVTDSNGETTYLKQYFSGSGSFQRAYVIGEPEGGYAEELVLAPCSLGVVIATVRVNKRNNKWRLDYHVST